MNLTIDFIIIGILIFSLARGGKQGFIKAASRVVVTVAALLGARWLSGKITQPVTDFFFPFFKEKILSGLSIKAIETEGMGIVERAVNGFAGAAGELMSVTAKAFVESIVHAAAFLVCFIVLKILLQLLVGFVDKIADIPGLDTVNTVLGATFGLIEASLLLFLVPYIAKNLGIKLFERLSADTFVLDFFVHSSPYDLIELLLR